MSSADPSEAMSQSTEENGEEQQVSVKEEVEDSNMDTNENDANDTNDSDDEDNLSDSRRDALGYTRRDEFTSEIYKLEVRGLPKYFSVGQLKRVLFENLQLDVKKIKPTVNNVCYITFSDETTLEMAVEMLEGYKWKNSVLTVAKSGAAPDPLVKRIIKQKADAALKTNKVKKDELPIRERVVQSVTPFADIPYQEQLIIKQEKVMTMMKKLGREISKSNKKLDQIIRFQKLRRKGAICEIDPIIPSPFPNGYRNKCEFTIGINPDTKESTVGFRISSYKEGAVSVGPVDNLKNVSLQMKKVVKLFEEYVKASSYDPFDPVSHEGVWRQLTIRTTMNDDCLIVVTFHPQKMPESEIKDIKDSLIEFCAEVGKDIGITSLYCIVEGQKESGASDNHEHLWGPTHIIETVLGKDFRISPQAFFQVNTGACEKLYETISEFIDVDPTTVIADVCCGTGTIGISLADKAHSVYGLEIVEQAIKDAKHNASHNEVTNAHFLEGNCEQSLPSIFSTVNGLEVKAVVDPPRAGLPASVIQTLRQNTEVSTVVYASCDPDRAITNFHSLCRSAGKQVRGPFFVPIRAVAVDMFPHTDKFELLVLFERYNEVKWDRIMSGNPRPKDVAYYNRIPPLPECEAMKEEIFWNEGMNYSWQESEEEEDEEKPMIGEWETVSEPEEEQAVWWTDELTELWANRKRLTRKYYRTRKPEDKIEFMKARHKFRSARRLAQGDLPNRKRKPKPTSVSEMVLPKLDPTKPLMPRGPPKECLNQVYIENYPGDCGPGHNYKKSHPKFKHIDNMKKALDRNRAAGFNNAAMAGYVAGFQLANNQRQTGKQKQALPQQAWQQQCGTSGGYSNNSGMGNRGGYGGNFGNRGGSGRGGNSSRGNGYGGSGPGYSGGNFAYNNCGYNGGNSGFGNNFGNNSGYNGGNFGNNGNYGNNSGNFGYNNGGNFGNNGGNFGYNNSGGGYNAGFNNGSGGFGSNNFGYNDCGPPFGGNNPGFGNSGKKKKKNKKRSVSGSGAAGPNSGGAVGPSSSVTAGPSSSVTAGPSAIGMADFSGGGTADPSGLQTTGFEYSDW